MSRSATPAIRVQHLSHQFGYVTVLHNLNFQVNSGEIFGFIGPNGAGKTTTIRILATLLEPSHGKVEICGVDLHHNAEAARRHIGYMADHAGVYERLTVEEYLEFFASAYGVRDPSAVHHVLELSDIGPLKDQLVETLSKGQKQRLQLARALVHDPDILILDEPASDLDPRARIEIRNLLLDLKDLGKTIFLSSHILTELDGLCTSVGVIEKGRMVVCGRVDELTQLLQQQRGQPMQAPATTPIAEEASSQIEGGSVPRAATLRKVRIRLLERSAEAAAQLTAQPFVAELTRHDHTLQLLIQGDDKMVAKLVKQLVQADFQIVEVETNSNRLEDIFLHATANPHQPPHGGQRS